MSIHGHTVMSGSSQGHAEVYSRIQGDALECREETYLMDMEIYVESSPLPYSSKGIEEITFSVAAII